MNTDWQPAVIAPRSHVEKLHKIDPGAVSQYAGQTIRVRKNDDAQKKVGELVRRELGCTGRMVEVHREDAERLWPRELEEADNVCICTCAILTD